MSDIRGGRRNSTENILDQIIFCKVAMCTNPTLDPDRHEFQTNTLLGRIQSPPDFLAGKNKLPVREIFPFIVAGMSYGALSPPAWEGLLQGVAYCNEVLNIPVAMSTGEGGIPAHILKSRLIKYLIFQIASGYFGWDNILRSIDAMKHLPVAIEIKNGQGAKVKGGILESQKVTKAIATQRGVPLGVSLYSPPVHQTMYSIEETVAKMTQTMSMCFDYKIPIYHKITATSIASSIVNNMVRNGLVGGLSLDGIDGATGAASEIALSSIGHPITSSLRDCYLELVKQGKENEFPLFAAGGVGKNGNVTQNGMALIMLGASGVQIGRYVLQKTMGCIGNEKGKCNICNTGKCPKGIATQDRDRYKKLDQDKVAQKFVDMTVSIKKEMQEIMAAIGRSNLPIGMSDALGVMDKNVADRLQIKYVC